MLLSKEKIKQAFSKSAPTYDMASDFQKETAGMLIEKILSDGACGAVLDVGMGTGQATKELVGIFSSVCGCDIAWGMVLFSKENLKGAAVSQADAEYLPYKDGVFDVVFSNITYQWVNDLGRSLSEVKRVLKKGGRFYFSILADGSLKELYDSLEAISGKNSYAGMLPKPGFVYAQFKDSGLKITWRREELIKRYYPSCLDLVRNLKLLGAGRVLGRNIFGMGQRELFFDTISSYDRNFNDGGRVFANYKVVLGRAEK